MILDVPNLCPFDNQTQINLCHFNIYDNTKYFNIMYNASHEMNPTIQFYNDETIFNDFKLHEPSPPKNDIPTNHFSFNQSK